MLLHPLRGHQDRLCVSVLSHPYLRDAIKNEVLA
jgi:hypothetical protein